MTGSRPEPPRLNAQLCFSLYAASRAMEHAYAPLLYELEITFPQYLTLMVLWEHDGATVGEIGHHLGLDSGTMTPLLKRLDVAGWVVRQRDTRDERRVRVYLTAAGRSLGERAAEAHHLALYNVSPRILADLADLKVRIDALTRALEERY